MSEPNAFPPPTPNPLAFSIVVPGIKTGPLVRFSCTIRRMRACKFFSMLLASVGIVFLLMALTTDYWLVAYGPSDIAHSGLWQACRNGKCFVPAETYDYIQATRAFLVLASLAAATSVLSLTASFLPCDYGGLSGSFAAAIAAFIAGRGPWVKGKWLAAQGGCKRVPAEAEDTSTS
ncbi:hypothetical protein lerEdw1_009660 [Lerista edwardsae]|nr:hypothetical protein lerEdw1_009660 [Lerista edwardsae]